MNNCTKSLLAIFLVLTAVRVNAAPNDFSTVKDKEVWGGVPLKHPESEWMVALVASSNPTPDNLVCGGTLLNGQWMITAAHCFYEEVNENCIPINLNNLYIAFGSANIDQSINTTPVAQVVYYKSYDCKTKENDIALVRINLDLDIKKKMLIPSSLNAQKMKEPHSNVYAAGWGLTKYLIPSLELMQVPLEIVDTNSCKMKYGTLPSNIFCAGGDGVHDTCKGDSGGPLFTYDSDHNSLLLGVVSFGKKCGEKNAPSINTDISAYQPWIKQTISQCSELDIANHKC